MRYVIVSGVPGSGKSTLARRLAPMLELPVLDKDDILDARFETLGVGDAEWRSTLSRSADEEFRRVALELGAAILVSWWRHPRSTSNSGTPTGWLASLPGGVVEVHCMCPPRIAAERFMKRQRHAGHLDATRDVQSLTGDLERLSALGPLSAGPVVQVLTSDDVDLDDLAESIRRHT
jgi:adenylylsulfate kinase-like enzyme